ncbi:beta-lactamase family protein [Exilibacterium tricleocarpae]|uniref:Beta-lactamase family protein n=1 Tax=Exilibacterium tricleocarpae TaxID=2591008 RepID=A0A545UA42_9GAMM|nr:beta-lactamase family protein [Exilibacterium tricleocarpae]
MDLQGTVAPGLEPVAQAFADNFRHRGEQGAALTVMRRGEVLLEIWAGTRDKGASRPWQADTRVNIFSAGKAFVAACVLQLVERGALALDAPVAQYWPEFAAHGKREITLRQVLCHRAGVSAFQRRQDDKVIFDWAAVTAQVAAAEPWWTPGTAQGYSPMLFGWLLGELVRRTSGCDSFDDYFQQQVAQPLQLAAEFGVGADRLVALADVGVLAVEHAGAAAGGLAERLKSDPRGVANRAFTNPISLLVGTNSRAWRQAQIPAANGHASATALARFYHALSTGGRPLLDARHCDWCWQQQSAGADRVLATPLRFSLGFMLSQDRPDCRFGTGARGFGHPGAGGCLGFGDPDRELGFGYVTNRMGQSVLMDARAVRLVQALYACL